MNSKRAVCFVFAICSLMSGSVIGGEAESIFSGKFRSPLLKRDLDFRVFAPASASDKALPMAVYVKGLGIERIGTFSDGELISGLLDKGMLVAEVDYQSNPKAKGGDMYIDVMYLYRVFGASLGINAVKPVVPRSKPRPAFPPLMDEFIRWDPEKVTVYEKFVAERGGKRVEYRIDPKWVYVMPAGYTIDRDIEIMTIKSDKRTNVHRMDVIYPAKPVKPVPAVLEISTSTHSVDPANHRRINRNSCYPFTWMMDGYAAAMMDNVANHVTTMSIYGESMTAPTGVHFPEKRALRLLRARKDEFGLSGKIAVMGISKCNMRAIMAGLVNGEHPNGNYVLEADKGPFVDESDRFDVMLTGGFPKRPIEFRMILDYLSDDDPALIWCQTVYLSRMQRATYVQDQLDKQAVLRDIEKRCKAFGVPCKNYYGTPTGHDFDYVYINDIINFADMYMK
jgi:hypothetical protein